MGALSELRFETYDESAAQEILRLAGSGRRRLDYFTSADLIRAAAELDIPESIVLEAEQLVKERQTEQEDREEYRRAKLRELSKFLFVGLPLVILVVALHGISLITQAFGALKGLLKGASAVLFSRSTKHELEFHSWRNDRFYKAEYGYSSTAAMLGCYFKERRIEERDVLVDWLIKVNGIDPSEAERAVDHHAEHFPKQVLQRKPTGASEPSSRLNREQKGR